MYKKLFPKRVKDGIKVMLGKASALPLKSASQESEKAKCFCSVCSSLIQKFNPLSNYFYESLDRHGFIFSIFQFETLNTLNYSCPNCGASDRDRLYALYLEKEVQRFESQSSFKLLDFAPSASLQKFIKNAYAQINYRSADLMMEGVDDVVDITHMNIYENGEFDFFICSHVLEHVEEDRKAISELYRILKPGGRGIVMVPIMLSLNEDYENSTITTPEDRWKHFGQNDHVRMYSKQGFISKLSSAGFAIRQLDTNFFGNESFEKHAIHPRSVLYIVEKAIYIN